MLEKMVTPDQGIKLATRSCHHVTYCNFPPFAKMGWALPVRDASGLQAIKFDTSAPDYDKVALTWKQLPKSPILQESLLLSVTAAPCTISC